MIEVGVTRKEAKAALLATNMPRVGEIYEVMSNRYLQAYKGDQWTVISRRLVSYAVLVKYAPGNTFHQDGALTVQDERFEQMLRDGHLKLVGLDMTSK